MSDVLRVIHIHMQHAQCTLLVPSRCLLTRTDDDEVEVIADAADAAVAAGPAGPKAKAAKAVKAAPPTAVSAAPPTAKYPGSVAVAMARRGKGKGAGVGARSPQPPQKARPGKRWGRWPLRQFPIPRRQHRRAHPHLTCRMGRMGGMPGTPAMRPTVPRRRGVGRLPSHRPLSGRGGSGHLSQPAHPRTCGPSRRLPPPHHRRHPRHRPRFRQSRQAHHSQGHRCWAHQAYHCQGQQDLWGHHCRGRHSSCHHMSCHSLDGPYPRCGPEQPQLLLLGQSQQWHPS